jgi:hypothetical protein
MQIVNTQATVQLVVPAVLLLSQQTELNAWEGNAALSFGCRCACVLGLCKLCSSVR